jgi:hypothetical protein
MHLFSATIKSETSINCIFSFSNNNLQFFEVNHNIKNNQILEYFTIWLKYIYNPADINNIQYIGELSKINENYKFDVVINEETNNILVNNNKFNKSIDDFLKDNNIIMELYKFDEDERLGLFINKHIQKYSKKIMLKYYDENLMGDYNEYNKDEDNIYDIEEEHPLIIKFCHYHNIYYGLNPYYLEQQKDYDIYTLSKDIIYNKSPYKRCNIKANLIKAPYNKKFFYEGHFNGKYITNYHLDEKICYHLIKKYVGHNDHEKTQFKIIKKQLKCLYKNINKIPDPNKFIKKIYSESTKKLEYLSNIIKTIDRNKKELFKTYILAYITQYCRQFKFTYNNYLYIHDNIEALDFYYTSKYHFIINEYCEGSDIDEDNFFDETKFFIKFNFGYLYFNHLDDFNDNSGWIITQFEIECMDKEMYPHFYNYLCLLMEDDIIQNACVREKSGRTHE